MCLHNSKATNENTCMLICGMVYVFLAVSEAQAILKAQLKRWNDNNSGFPKYKYYMLCLYKVVKREIILRLWNASWYTFAWIIARHCRTEEISGLAHKSGWFYTCYLCLSLGVEGVRTAERLPCRLRWHGNPHRALSNPLQFTQPVGEQSGFRRVVQLWSVSCDHDKDQI